MASYQKPSQKKDFGSILQRRTRIAAGPNFKPEVRLRRIEGFEPSAQSRQGGRPKDFFEMTSIFHAQGARVSYYIPAPPPFIASGA
jgi:hypothetical protein